MRRLKHRRIVVHTKDDQSLRGVFVANHSDSIRLAAPEYLERAKETPTNFPGEALILKSNISWIQILEG